MTHMDQTVTSGSGWRKSSLSYANGNCVEVNVTETVVLLRNSRDQDGPVLMFTHREWSEFLEGAGRGEFSLPGETAERD